MSGQNETRHCRHMCFNRQREPIFRAGNCERCDIKEACQFAVRGPENELELSKASFCKGFVKTLVSVGRRLNKPDSFCAPDGVTVGQTINVFLKYLNDNPNKAQQAAADLAITAFGTAWRCK
jgi:Rap1a immunity proteins